MANLFALEKQFVEKSSEVYSSLVIHILTSFDANNMLDTEVKEHLANKFWCAGSKVNKTNLVGFILEFIVEYLFLQSDAFSSRYLK